MAEVKDMQAENWNDEVTNEKGPVVIDFWHHMCGWCQKLNPVYAQLPEAIDNVKFFKINILESTENRRLAIERGVMSTPTIKVYCEGRDIGEIVGYRPYERLIQELKVILNQKDSCLEQSTPIE
jgi:thioredoxin 1